ncbi:MAG: hypothetical protein HY315_10630 [Acidobacteria bacterium]|nr:hypothetical protein [Acidobacteriota bacterium]
MEPKGRSLKDHIKKHTGLEFLESASGWKGPCPFEPDSRAGSFLIFDQGDFYCFTCKVQGGISEFDRLWQEAKVQGLWKEAPLQSGGAKWEPQSQPNIPPEPPQPDAADEPRNGPVLQSPERVEPPAAQSSAPVPGTMDLAILQNLVEELGKQVMCLRQQVEVLQSMAARQSEANQELPANLKKRRRAREA